MGVFMCKRQIEHLVGAFVALVAVVTPLGGVDQLVVLVVAFLVEALAAELAFPVIFRRYLVSIFEHRFGCIYYSRQRTRGLLTMVCSRRGCAYGCLGWSSC